VTEAPKIPPWPPPPAPAPTVIPPAPTVSELNRIIQYLDAIYKYQHQTTKWKWILPKTVTLTGKSELELVSLENGGELTLSLAKISMPDNTEPDLKFIAKTYDLTSGSIKNVVQGESPSKLYELGLTVPNDYAILTLYDATAYHYAWLQQWRIKTRSGEGITVSIRNDTVKNATLNYAVVEGLMLPEAAYKSRIF